MSDDKDLNKLLGKMEILCPLLDETHATLALVDKEVSKHSLQLSGLKEHCDAYDSRLTKLEETSRKWEPFLQQIQEDKSLQRIKKWEIVKLILQAVIALAGIYISLKLGWK